MRGTSGRTLTLLGRTVASRRFARGRRGRPVPRVTSAGASARSSVALGNDAPHGRAAKSRRARRRLVSRRPARFQGTRRRPPRRRRGSALPVASLHRALPVEGASPFIPGVSNPIPRATTPHVMSEGASPFIPGVSNGAHPRPQRPTRGGTERGSERDPLAAPPRAPRTRAPVGETDPTDPTDPTDETDPTDVPSLPSDVRLASDSTAAHPRRGFPRASPPHPERRRRPRPGTGTSATYARARSRAAHAEGPRARADADGVGDSHRGRVRAEQR